MGMVFRYIACFALLAGVICLLHPPEPATFRVCELNCSCDVPEMLPVPADCDGRGVCSCDEELTAEGETQWLVTESPAQDRNGDVSSEDPCPSDCSECACSFSQAIAGLQPTATPVSIDMPVAIYSSHIEGSPQGTAPNIFHPPRTLRA